MAIFSDLELMGIMNESKQKKDDSIIDSAKNRVKKNSEQVKDGFDKMSNNVKDNLWITKHKKKKVNAEFNYEDEKGNKIHLSNKDKNPSKITFKEDASGNIIGCSVDEEYIEENIGLLKKAEKAKRDLTNKSAVAIEKEKQDSEIANARKTQVGSGDRSEKIRTYNYPQGRITDHRIGMSIFQMENFLNGDLDEMIDNLIAADRAEKLQGSEEE